jgi:putative intracellular protease/amidase/glyoxylase-like metal-dependent hydrolase (beta-lactamase superfamily II)
MNANTKASKKILLIAANPSTSKNTGWPIGFWWSELTHPYAAFTEAGYTVEIRSPNGGALQADGFSDPEDPSGYSAHDIISLGFKKSPKHLSLLQDTKSIDRIESSNYDAIFVTGGQSPMYTFRGNTKLQKLLASFYEAGKVAALVCHGTAMLLETKLSSGELLVTGKTWTGFANSEEAFADNFVGKRIQPFWIEDEARAIKDTTFRVASMFAPFAIRDGRLITGQQQNSGRVAAELVIEALSGVTAAAPVTRGNGISIARHVHSYFNANAWLLMNSTHAILIDTASNSNEDGEHLATFIKSHGRELQAVVLSHGHPDIFFGAKSLASHFPKTSFYVAKPEIIDDILGMARTMEQYGMLPSPDLSADSFDYRGLISLLPEAGLTLEGAPSFTLKTWVTPAPSEFTHLTSMWSAELNLLFTSDLAYNHVHSWAGIGVDRVAIDAWLGFLDGLIKAHPGLGIRVLTGHGPEGDGNILLAQRAYLMDLASTLDRGLRGEALEAEMVRRYPGYKGASFQLHMTATNPAFVNSSAG